MAERAWRVLTINPGSTSTKVGMFEGEKPVFTTTIEHDAKRLATFPHVSDQLPYRREMILGELNKHGVKLQDVDAFVGRGGG